MHTATQINQPIVVSDDRGDGHQAVASAALAVTYAIAIAALVLVIVNRPEWQVWQWYFVVDLADAFVFGAVGYVLLSRVAHPVAGWVAACGLGGALAAFGAQWTEVTFQHPSAPMLPFVQSLQNWAWVPGTLALIHIVPWLVRDGVTPAIARAMSWAGGLLFVTIVAFRFTNPFPWPLADPIMPFAIEDQEWSATVEDIDTWLMGVVVVLGALAAVDLVRRWRSAPIERRRGLGWLAIGVSLMTISFLPLALPVTWTDWLPAEFTPLMHLGSQLFFPAALLVAVLGQRLWGIRLAVNRTVAWSLLTAVLIAGYVGLVGLIELIVPGVDDGVTSVAVTALIAAAVGPVRRFVQRRVDHLVHGESREPIRVVDRVGRGIGRRTSPTELLVGVLDDLVGSLRLSGASIVVAERSGDRAAQVGDTTGDGELTLPLVLDEELIGSLSVWPRPGERLDGATERALTALVPTVAVASRLAATAEALADSRARIAAARDEERRALRRELHDGLGPALAGVGYGLQAARNLLTVDPAAAGQLLDRLASELDSRIEEVRTLAREMVPPVLLEAGLPAALEELAQRHRLTGLTVELDIGEVASLDPTMASTLYGISVEAVRNVVRHASATTCRIALDTATDGTLTLSIADDGVGIATDATSGIGLQSMRERADAIGAELAVGRALLGGTVVTLRAAAVPA